MQGDVWVAPGGIFGAGVIGENIINAWVQKNRNSTRVLDLPVPHHPVNVSG